MIGFQRGIGRIQTRIALNRCQRLTTSIMVIRLTLPAPATCMLRFCIEFPLVMWGALRLHRWGGQWTQLLRAAREFLGAKPRRNAGATWQGVICEAWIYAEFRQQGSGPPTWMRPAHLQDGLTHSRRKRAERSGSGAAHAGAETSAPLVLSTAAPCAHCPDRATQRRRNLGIGLSSRSGKVVVCPRRSIEPPIVPPPARSAARSCWRILAATSGGHQIRFYETLERCTRHDIPRLNMSLFAVKAGVYC